MVSIQQEAQEAQEAQEIEAEKLYDLLQDKLERELGDEGCLAFELSDSEGAEKKYFELTRSDRTRMRVEIFHEIGGLCVHHSVSSPIISGEFLDRYFVVSHFKAGCSIVDSIDGLQDAIACCKFLIEEAAKSGFDWLELETIEQVANHPQKDKIEATVKKAIARFRKL